MTQRPFAWLTFAAAVILFGAAVSLQASRDRAYPRTQQDGARVLYLPTGPALRRVAFGFDALAADVYWIRAIQHYGGDRLAPDRPHRYELLQPLLDATTTLDPRFTLAYRFGAIFLSEPPPGGPGRPDQAIALLQKGLAAEPGKWEYLHDIGFVEFWSRHDPVAAAAWFERAADAPGAPNWRRPLAAAVLAERDRQSARLLWRRLLASDQPWMQQAAERSLRQLDALDQIDRLHTTVRRARAAGVPARTWSELHQAGLLPGIPVDPAGVPFVLDAESGEISVSPESPLSPMPDLTRLRP
jgi:hypothetical protein